VNATGKMKNIVKNETFDIFLLTERNFILCSNSFLSKLGKWRLYNHNTAKENGRMRFDAIFETHFVAVQRQ